jgi:formate C-acetyltransferase
MIHKTKTTIKLPVNNAVVMLTQRPEISNLREIALRVQSRNWDYFYRYTLPLIDAKTLLSHSTDEDWLIWRARRTAARLKEIPIDLSQGELIVGRPSLCPPTPEEVKEIKSAQKVLRSIPPYPGGDSGHFHPDFDKLFRIGVRGIHKEIQSRIKTSKTEEQRIFYHACEIVIQGLSKYARRVADECELAIVSDADDAKQWQKLARICRHVSMEPPSTFHEAIELMFLTIIALWFGEDHVLTTPGRMDQTLHSFYEADLATGRITRDKALELICCLYIQLNMILGHGSAISVMVGGHDRDGNDVTSELTYLCLVARIATNLVYPTVGIAWHEGTPPELTDFACQMLRTGIGDPAFFNDELIASGLRDHGVSYDDSYNYMNSTCVEIKVVGASNIWVMAPYFNCPKALLEVMDQVANGSISEPSTFDELNECVKKQLALTVRKAAESLHQTWELRVETGCFPLASCLINDCLERGMDFDRNGARYNWIENSFVGLANLVDGLFAIKQLVYESRELSLNELHNILQANYKGHEALRQRILNRIPNYGNNNDKVDNLAVEWAEFLEETTKSNIVDLHSYVPGFFCWVVHEQFGTETRATPDGRKAGLALADGAGAAQGRDRNGPTSSIISTTKWNHKKAIGGLVQNVKFSKNTLKNEKDLASLKNLIETYLRRGGFEIQVNVVDVDVLHDAQAHPENYRDLLVRVAGYSDYFIHLNQDMQKEIIARTEHNII